jgi:hypothetical protein
MSGSGACAGSIGRPRLRPVVADDGREIMLTVYDADRTVAAMTLSVSLAVNIAGELIAAVSRRLQGASSTRPRGGDHRSDKRARRDEALRDFATLLGADLSLEDRAAQIIGKVTRYRPTARDKQGSSERRLLHRIAETGLPVPGERQMRRILAKRKTALDGQNSALSPNP